MITQEYIDHNKTAAFSKGDKVVMSGCAESEFYGDRIWICRTDSYVAYGGDECVFLEGFVGCFLAKFLKPKP